VQKDPGKQRLVRWFVPLAAVAAGGGLAFWVAASYERDLRDRVQIEALEREVLKLEVADEVARITRVILQPPSPAARPPHAYAIRCQAPWQELGPIGPGLWGCRTPDPLPGGFYPNCNLTTSRVAPGTTAQQYYESAPAHSASLAAAQRLGGRAIVARGRPAYEAIFEHQSVGIPLRVLASLFVEGEQLYAITCSAPVANFDALSTRFREIAASFELGG
jgi:hypothetical protein